MQPHHYPPGSLALIAPNARIHPSAVIDASASIAADAEIGPYVNIGAYSQIGQGSKISAHAIIGDYTRLGRDCRVYSHAVVGSPSQDLKHVEGCESWLIIGDRNRIREFVTINRATAAGAATVLGDDNLLMAYAHVAHDCQLGNKIVLANGVTLGGHALIEDETIIGAMSGIHQFVRIGRLAMIGAMSRVCNDVPPFMLASGAPPKLYGLNSVGLRRSGLSKTLRQQLKAAFQALYRRGLSQQQALEQILEQLSAEPLPELQQLHDFIQSSQRGLVGAAPPDWEVPQG